MGDRGRREGVAQLLRSARQLLHLLFVAFTCVGCCTFRSEGFAILQQVVDHTGNLMRGRDYRLLRAKPSLYREGKSATDQRP